MKPILILLLKLLILIIAGIVLIGMIRFPQLEGRAVNLDLVSIYRDPFIIYTYIASIPFFILLYQTFKLLGFIDKNKVISNSLVNSVRSIKYCALSLIVFLVIGILYIRLFTAGGDDPAGPTALSIITIPIFICITAVAVFFEKRLK